MNDQSFSTFLSINTDSNRASRFTITKYHSVALCRIKLLPVTRVLVDTWMLTVKLVYELSNVSGDLKWATNRHMTPFTLSRNN